MLANVTIELLINLFDIRHLSEIVAMIKIENFILLKNLKKSKTSNSVDKYEFLQ